MSGATRKREEEAAVARPDKKKDMQASASWPKAKICSEFSLQLVKGLQIYSMYVAYVLCVAVGGDAAAATICL